MKNKNITKKLYRFAAMCLISLLLCENIPVSAFSKSESTINDTVSTYNDEPLVKNDYNT